MNPVAITTVINFCTYDVRFLRACIEGVRPFSNKIIVNVCDHFFDGTEEDYALLTHLIRQFPECQFIEYAFDKESYRLFTPYYPEHHNWRHEWANTGRWISYHHLPETCDYILFLDADEIIDGAAFVKWLEQTDITPYAALSFSAYWYFREARYRATQCDDISVMIKKEAMTSEHFWSSDERAGLLMGVAGKKLYQIKGVDERPLVHHYSWVRTKVEMRKKFLSWSHHWERPWMDLLEQEYARDFSGVDFIRRYSYETVTPYFDPLAISIPDLEPMTLAEHVAELPHVLFVDRTQMQRRELLMSVNDV